MKAEEWKRRAAEQYLKKAGVTKEQAIIFAEATWQVFIEDGGDEGYTPEQWVDEDLSYWTDDQT